LLVTLLLVKVQIIQLLQIQAAQVQIQALRNLMKGMNNYAL
jgi:hypothetical protein